MSWLLWTLFGLAGAVVLWAVVIGTAHLIRKWWRRR